MLITSIYNLADTFFVGRISTSASGAVGVVSSLMAIIQAIGFFFGQGSGNFISREIGHKNYQEASEMASTGFFSAFSSMCTSLSLPAMPGSIFRMPESGPIFLICCI